MLIKEMQMKNQLSPISGQKVFQKLTRVYITANGVREGALSHTMFMDWKT